MTNLWLLTLLSFTIVSLGEETEETDVTPIDLKEDLKPNAALQVDVTKTIPDDECKIKSQNGDTLSMHYTGTLYKDGTKFDSSRDRDSPFEFELGAGRVIKGWDQGLLHTCIGEKRLLTIPSDLGYGDQGAGEHIPGGATLVFETELLDIKRPKPDFILMTYEEYEESKNADIDLTQVPENEFQVIGFVKKDSKREYLFSTFAKQLKSDPQISFYKVFLKKNDKFKVVMRRNNKEEFINEKLYGEFEVSYDGKLAPTKKARKSVFTFKEHDISTWVGDQRFPLFIKLGLEYTDPYSVLYNSPKIPQNGIILIRTPDDDAAVPKMKADLVDTARDLRSKGYMVALSAKVFPRVGFTADVNMVLIRKSIETMPDLPSGYKPTGSADPNDRVRSFIDAYNRDHSKESKETIKEYRYVFSGNVNNDNLKQFFKDAVVDKTGKRWIRSADDNVNLEEYETVTANTFKDVVLDKETDVLVLYCIESSGYCGTVKEEYNKLTKHMKEYYKGKSIKIAYMDGDENDLEDLRVTKFPTMVLYKAGTDKIKKGKLLSEERQGTMDDIVDFIDEFATSLNKEEL